MGKIFHKFLYIEDIFLKNEYHKHQIIINLIFNIYIESTIELICK